MRNLPILKKYDIDYDFIIKNYLNPEMWQKIWTLFVYRTFVVTLRIASIDCRNEKIYFEIKIKDNSETNLYRYEWGTNYDKETSNSASYSLKINDINFLKKEIESKILSTIERLEEYAIRATDEFLNLEQNYQDEEKILTKIAEDFLDSNSVTNEEIRDAYISSYVEKNSKLGQYEEELIDNLRYKIFPDFYLLFVEATKKEDLINIWKNKISDIIDLNELREKINKYIQEMETEEFEISMYDNLEDL